MVALLCATFLITPTAVNAVEKDNYDDWKTTAIISPDKGQLKAGGPIEVQFNSLEDAKYYEIYLDDQKQQTVQASDQDVIETDIYTTKTAIHTVKVVAVTDKNYEINSNIRSFKVSKKGVNIDDKNVLAQVSDMGESWYYNWGHTPSSHISGDKEYVPMLWNNTDIEWLKGEGQNYSTVLGFNEPDNAAESNMSAATVASYQKYFTESGLRVGAPATTYSPSTNEWFEEYISQINIDDIDFIPVHIYYDWHDENMVSTFLAELDATYAKYQKPIWVTEYGLANSANNHFYGSQDNPNFDVAKGIKEYMTETINGLEERDYVERYTWFSFGTNDTNGGKTSLYDQATGSLTSLGITYKTLGNPVVPSDYSFEDVYVEDEMSQITNVSLNKDSLVLNSGEKETLIATVETDNDNDDKTLSWTSSDENIATVDENGCVTAINPGTVKITATSINEMSATCTVVVRLPITDIEFNYSSLTLDKGTQYKLFAIIKPSGTTDSRDLKWTSSNEDVATVDEFGNVNAVSNGKAVITAKAANGVKADCDVSVVTRIENIELSQEEVKLEKGANLTITAKINPSDTTDSQDLTWTSSNEKIATVVNGKITALKPGTARIIATSENGKSTTCRVIVVSSITGVKLNKTTLSVNYGHNEVLKATITPSDTTDSKKLTWSSSNTKVAKVDQSGVVTPVNAGTAIITVKTSNGKTATCQVTVKKPIVSVSLNKSKLTLYKGKTETLKATINPSNTTDSKTLTWKSSNTNVVKVNSQGKLTAVNGGSATITVTTANKKTATCKVIVPYTVTYKLNGGLNTTANPKYYYGKKITLKNATRTGYTFGGWYSDSKFKNKVTSFSSGNKTLYAKWTKVSVPKGNTPSLTNISSKKIKVTYNKVSNVKGYQIQYSTNSKMTNAKTVLTTSNTYTLSSLTKGKTYYVRVRAYKLDSKGNKVYGYYSSIKSIKVTK